MMLFIETPSGAQGKVPALVRKSILQTAPDGDAA